MPELNLNALAQQGPQGIYQGFMQGQQIRNQMAAQEQQRLMSEQQRQLGEIQMQNALREQRLAGEEEAAWKAGAGNPQQILQELQQRGLGKQAMALQTQMSKAQADKLAAAKATAELAKQTATQAMANPQNAAQIYANFGKRLGIDVSDDLAEIQGFGGDLEKIKNWASGHALEADKLLPKFENMNLQGGVVRQGYNPITGAPMGPATVTPVMPLPADVEAQKTRIALASRPPAQPVAPTITTIVDPTDPNKMITIDARRYSGGGVGSPGVIGTAGKEPSAALRTNKIEEGKSQLQDELDNLRGAYTTLNEARAIQSTERGPLANIAASVQGSAVGQMAGRMVGTKEQVERDVINSAKQRLVVAIKNATGMSAQQLNSNVELQTMLRSLSDPSQGYDAAMRIINDIEDAYVRGAGMKKKTSPPPAATQGTGGFKYLGKEGE